MDKDRWFNLSIKLIRFIVVEWEKIFIFYLLFFVCIFKLLRLEFIEKLVIIW